MAYNNTPKVALVIDIETVGNPISQADLDSAMSEYEPPANYKTPEAIERHKLKFQESLIKKLSDEKAFSIGGKRMVSAALGRVDENEREVIDIQSWASDDLSVITRGLVSYLDQFRDYRLVGWNHIGFDLPEVAKSFQLTNVRPKYKPSKWDLIDLCNHPFRKTKLKDAARAFGIEPIGVNGGDVAQMYAEGRFEDIQRYNEDDVRITGELYIATQSIFSFF